MENWREVLKQEFDGEPGSFIRELRFGRGWNQAAYERLFVAMRECCKAHEGKEVVERWIADGFWYLSCYPEQSEPKVATYRTNAFLNFYHLASWLFSGDSRGDDEFEPV